MYMGKYWLKGYHECIFDTPMFSLNLASLRKYVSQYNTFEPKCPLGAFDWNNAGNISQEEKQFNMQHISRI